MIEARKLSFQEVWDSSAVFFVDEELEQEIESEVDKLLETARDHRVSTTVEISEVSIAAFLVEKDHALDVILKDIGLSEEKFMRLISLLRRIGRIPGGFDGEWSIRKIKSLIEREAGFASMIARLLIDGKRDKVLRKLVPRYYLDTLNYREIKGGSEAARRVRYKSELIGTYGGRKGHRVEALIRERLERIKTAHGIGHEKGRSMIVETDIDFAVPTLEDPWVIIMSSFQETTSSGQTTKTRDMLSAYERVTGPKETGIIIA